MSDLVARTRRLSRTQGLGFTYAPGYNAGPPDPGARVRVLVACDNDPDEIDGPYVDLGMNALCVCPADFTGNGEVDGADLGILVAFWGPCRSADCPADLNHDGVVNGGDLGLLLGFWGPCD